MNMMTRLKEATIDLGRQPVRFAKFTQISWAAVVKMCETLEKVGPSDGI